MSPPATLAWFARHELRLTWRDWLAMMSAGRRRRERWVAAGIALFAVFAHLLALAIIAPLLEAGVVPDHATLAFVTGCGVLSWTMMLSQAMETVTRAFYARGDLDLILSSPASVRRVFAVRMAAIAVSTALTAMLLAGPFVNVLAFYGGLRWVTAYGVLLAMGAASTALAVLITVALFRTIGPRRTRLVSQVLAAIVGAAFVIGVQAAAILSSGGLSRVAVLRSEAFVARMPDVTSVLWWPARAAMGDWAALGAVLGLGLGSLALVVAVFSCRFGDSVVQASGVASGPGRGRRRPGGFRPASIGSALRRKEWTLLRRDPWLVSQSLMQVLYLLPPALLLWRNFGDATGTLLILVPVLVMAAGQLAGGLAWLAVSGEDAPDLVASAPVSPRAVIRAKVEAVAGAIAAVTAPLLAVLALAAPRLAIVAAFGIALSTASATVIQIWFRAQAKRSSFRRRQTSSRVATFAEAFSSILWACAAGLAAAGTWLAGPAAMAALCVLGTAWTIRPREPAAG